MSPRHRAFVCGIAASWLFSAPVPAEEKSPLAVLELGGGAVQQIHGGASFGPSAAIEFEPIKESLVVETGLAPLFDSHGRSDWDFDVLFRYPFQISKQVEFEPGIGPTWSSAGDFGVTASFEFMIWPWGRQTFGWFVDPSYSMSFKTGHQQALGLSLGVLVPIPAPR